MWAFLLMFCGSSLCVAWGCSYFYFCCEFSCRGRVSPRQASSFLFATKRNQKARLRRCPAELAARLQHFAQTAAGNMKDFHEVERDAYARGAVLRYM
jgi:hypothetical protein